MSSPGDPGGASASQQITKRVRTPKSKRIRFSDVTFVAVIIFLFIPLVMLFLYSFNGAEKGKGYQVSTIWYTKLLFESRDLWGAFLNSVIIAVTSALTATVFGTMSAIAVNRFKFWFRGFVGLMSFIPMILPEIVMGVSLLIFFAGVGLKLGLVTIWIAHTTFNIPFVYLLVSARIDEFDPTIIEAARDLGASETQTLLKIILPMSAPGIISAFLTAITLSLEDFVITFFVAGPGSTTLPLYIYSAIRFGVSPVINALSVLMVAGTILLIYPMRNFLKVYASR